MESQVIVEPWCVRWATLPYAMQCCHIPLCCQIREMESQVIGRTLVRLVGDRTECRFRECNLGNLIADGALRRCLMAGGSGWSQVRKRGGWVRKPGDR